MHPLPPPFRETAGRGPARVIVPEGDELMIDVDSPPTPGIPSARWPTVMIYCPSVYRIAGWRYESNATVALCIKSEWYEIRVLNPERHVVTLVPYWFGSAAFSLILWAFMLPILPQPRPILDRIKTQKLERGALSDP